MSESKFTPGPWVARQEFANRWRIEVRREGCIPISIGLACTTILEAGCSDADTAANAHLIAAAPELYAAAKRALNVFKAQGESVRPGSVLGALDAALAKARDQSPSAASAEPADPSLRDDIRKALAQALGEPNQQPNDVGGDRD